MALSRHLVIFARAPRLGAVKRRLAKDVGAAQAVRFQRVMLHITLRRLARDPRWTTWLALTPAQTYRVPPRVTVIGQGPGDLGQRMANVARALPPGPVVIVGSDIPGVRPTHIAAAFGKLGHSDAVFGPATDGGYWLVGLKRRPCFYDPFAAVRWSSPHALADTLANLTHRKVAFVGVLADVDDGKSLRRQPKWGILNRAD